MSASCAGDRDLAAVAEVLRSAGRLVLTTHVRPDADALGSAAGLHSAAAAAGKACRIVVPDAVPARYAFLFRDAPPDPAERLADLADRADAVVVLDTSSLEQLGPIAEALAARRGKIVVIDHHVTADDIAAVAWRDPSAPATAAMIVRLLAALAWPLTAQVAEALLAGLGGDTGWFRHSNTDAAALSVAAALAAAGARPNHLYRRLYQSDRPQRLALLGRALASLTFHAAGRIAAMTLTPADFAETGAAHDETEDFVNEPLRVAGVEVSVIFIAEPAGPVRVSLRSREDARGAAVDVAVLAARFGGGGHPRAAGCRPPGDIPAITRAVLSACTEALRRASA